MTTKITRKSPARQFGEFVLASLAGERARRRWLAQWLQLPPPLFKVAVKRKIKITMRDGRVLLADHYYPRTQEVCPSILIRSPWGRGWDKPPFSIIYMFIAQRMAEHGYHVLVQSTNALSFAGSMLPSTEAEDSKETLDWVARQSWFNGSLGMWGPSILGYILWTVAEEASPFLKALVPSITSSNWRDTYYQDNAFALENILVLLTMLYSVQPARLRKQLERQSNLPAELAALPKKLRLAKAVLHLPLREADTIGLDAALPGAYREVLEHTREDDPYWQRYNQRTHIAQISTPMHLVGGWHDIFLRSLVLDYSLLKAGGQTPYLTIGPWGHVSPEVGWASLREALAWYDVHLKGMPERLRKLPVSVYVLGAEQWRDLVCWPPTDITSERRYYLHRARQLSQELPGTIADEPAEQYCYDPADPTPTIGGPLLDPKRCGSYDNRALEARPDILCYTTSVLEHALTIMGAVRVDLYVRSTSAYSDFFARVCAVHSDGRSMNICDGLLRLQPDGDNGEPQADGSLRIQLTLWPIAYRFDAGQRIRLQIASGAHPRWNRNSGTGEPPARTTKMLVATQTIYHDDMHPSALILPVEDQHDL